jgi:hypothetical protein
MRRAWKTFGIPLLLLIPASGPRAQEQGAPPAPATAPVTLDGEELFRVRDVSAFPAQERAASIARAIREAAEDPAVDPRTVAAEPTEFGTRIMAGSHRIMAVVDADAQPEGIHTRELAAIYAQRISRALVGYRQARTPAAVVDSNALKVPGVTITTNGRNASKCAAP